MYSQKIYDRTLNEMCLLSQTRIIIIIIHIPYFCEVRNVDDDDDDDDNNNNNNNNNSTSFPLK